MSDRVRIRFPLEQDEDGYPGVSDEFLWAEPLADGHFRVDNIPFFVLGVSLGDHVEADLRNDGALVYTCTVRVSGHRTVRLLFARAEDVEAGRAELRALACPSELSHVARLVSVDVPPDVSATVIRAFLAHGEESGRFECEEAAVDW